MKAIAIPQDELERLYYDELMTQLDIAKLYNCSQATVRNYMLKYEIPIRSKSAAQVLRNQDHDKRNQGRAGELNGNYRHGLYIQERIYRDMVELGKCSRCSSTDDLLVHHKNEDHYDNHPENLEVLCRSCHFSHHKILYWQQQRDKA